MDKDFCVIIKFRDDTRLKNNNGGESIMNVCCLLTARGHNTLENKHILMALDRPIIYYPASAGKMAKSASSWYASSDSSEILSIAGELGYKPIKRPEEISRPDSQHVDAITHAMKFINSDLGTPPDILVVMLGNNVSFDSNQIDECVKIMMDDYDAISAVVPVYEDSDHNPMRAKKMLPNGNLTSFMSNMPENTSSNRQDLEKSYFLAHSFWTLNVKRFLSGEEGPGPWKFMGRDVKPYITERSIDIHDTFDLRIAEEWLKISPVR